MWEATIRSSIKYLQRPTLCLTFALVTTLGIAPSVGWSQSIPANLQAAIFFKVLSYDGNIPSKDGSAITIYVVTDSKTAGQKAAFLAGFGKLKGQQIGGKTINISAVTAAEASNVANSNTILYVAAGSDDSTIKKVLAVAVAKKCATLGGSEALAQKGLAVGLSVEGGKPKIVINFPASQKQGMKLSSKVLRLAKVIK
jgi:hypothetical protein